MKKQLTLFALALLGACSHKTETDVIVDPYVEPEVKTCTPRSGTICTVVGTDRLALAGDAGPANKASLYWPMDVAFGPNGNLYVVDWNNHRIRMVDKATGKIDTVAGIDDLGDGPINVDAKKSHFNHPTNIVFDKAGNMHIAAWHNSKVKTVSTTNILTDTCGTGARAYNGDGGTADKAAFDLPGALAFAADGTLYIMDQANQRIRAVDAMSHVVTNFAGAECLVNKCMTGEMPEPCPNSQKKVCNLAMNAKLCMQVPGCVGSFGGDDGPAADLHMNQPVSQAADPGGRLAFDKNGDLFFADQLNHRIRKIDMKTKVVTTVAGKGTAGFSGDGGKATDAELDHPTDIAFGTDGTMYVADTFNNCVRAVKDGTISTAVGQCKKSGFAGDEGKPTEALLSKPYGVEVGPNGDLYVADSYNGRIRVVSK
jgi:hypothetical protein